MFVSTGLGADPPGARLPRCGGARGCVAAPAECAIGAAGAAQASRRYTCACMKKHYISAVVFDMVYWYNREPKSLPTVVHPVLMQVTKSLLRYIAVSVCSFTGQYVSPKDVASIISALQSVRKHQQEEEMN